MKRKRHNVKACRRLSQPANPLTLESRRPLSAILTDLYRQVGVPRRHLDFSAIKQIERQFNARRGAGVAFPMQ